MSEKNNLPKLTQDETNRLRGLYQGMYSLDFTTKIDSYQKFATQVFVLRQQGHNIQGYEKDLTRSGITGKIF